MYPEDVKRFNDLYMIAMVYLPAEDRRAYSEFLQSCAEAITRLKRELQQNPETTK